MRGQERSRLPLAWGPVGVVAAVAAVVHLAVATRYGWHRDEFYDVICGRHPAWGYVDQPPLTPLLARFAAALPGGLLPLRLVAVAAQIGCILLTAVLAAELGGRRRAQVIAAAAVAACPIFVGASALYGTAGTDQLTFPEGVDNAEKSGGAAIYLCQQPRGSWAELWPGLKHFD